MGAVLAGMGKAVGGMREREHECEKSKLQSSIANSDETGQVDGETRVSHWKRWVRRPGCWPRPGLGAPRPGLTTS